MATAMIDPATALAFSVFENRGVYAVLLGSGVSRAAQIPTGWEVTLDLVRRVGTLEGAGHQADWAAWYRQKTGKEPDYSEVLDAIATSPDERRSILHSYIEPTAEDAQEGRKVPTRAHHAIAWLVREGFVRVILTTNFDRLMENALREAGVEPTVIRSDDDLQGAVPLTHSRCFLVKLHGDYLDSRIKNTNEELGAYSAPVNSLLDRIFDEHGLIACGWSGDWDHALRAAIQRAPSRRYPFYWASRGALSLQGEDLLRHRRGTMLPIADADSFFDGLRRRVEALAATQRPNVQSTELLVATAKQYLARPEHRIRLNDLLAEEHRRLVERLGDPAFSVQAQWSAEEFRRRVSSYEASTEALGRVFGAMGRWGDGAALELASELVQDLAQQPSVGGTTVWIEMRAYPAMLLLYAYGLGLLKGGRHEALFRWFSQRIATSRRESEPIVRTLLLGAWAGGEQNIWQQLKGLERRKTPLSDHLHDVLSGWTKDYLLAVREFTRLFEAFEVLGALAFITLRATKEELIAAHSATGQRDFVWSPIGRAAWDGEHRDAILASLEEPDTRRRLLDAGFARGDDQFLSLALESVRRLMGRIGW
jgi:phosphoserine phosphatase